MCESVLGRGYFILCVCNIARAMEGSSIGFGDAGSVGKSCAFKKMEKKVADNKMVFSATASHTVTLWEKRGGLKPCVRAWQGCTLEQGL